MSYDSNEHRCKWQQVCAKNGVGELFDHYLILAAKVAGADIAFNKEKSVAVHLGGSPVLSLHPKKSKGETGLFIGYSRTNLGRHILSSCLPSSFEHIEKIQGNNEWRFGYFRTVEELELLFSGLDSKTLPSLGHIKEVRPLGKADLSVLPDNPEKLSLESMSEKHPSSLNSLSIDDVFQLAKVRGLKPKRWSGSRLKTYNGYSHEVRVRKWQAMDLACRMGLLEYADSFPCSICGSRDNVAYHSEDYSQMSGHYPVCKSCHNKLHFRFSNPQRWRTFIRSHGTDRGDSWFENVELAGE